jgi:hypothetical protein
MFQKLDSFPSDVRGGEGQKGSCLAGFVRRSTGLMIETNSFQWDQLTIPTQHPMIEIDPVGEICFS